MRDLWVKRAAALLAGGMLGVLAPAGSGIWLFSILVLIGIRILLWQPKDFFGRMWRPEILLLGATVLVGFVYGMTGNVRLPEPVRLEGTEVRGTLLEWRITEDRASGTLELIDMAGGKVVGSGQEKNLREEEFLGLRYRVLVYPEQDGDLPSGWEKVQPGDTLTFRANLERAPESGTPGGFDRRIYDNVRGLSGTLTAKGYATVNAMGDASWVWQLREHVSYLLEVWNTPETGVLEGILFGDSSRIPPEIQEDYRVTGVLHVFAASGSNVAFVAALFWMLLGFLPRTGRVAGTCAVLLFYAALCGGNAPILRATVLGVAALLGSLGQGKFSALRWLLFAAVGLFLINPLILRDIGFQLSFAAAWGIIVVAPRLAALQAWRKVPLLLRQIMAVTWAAQLATLPLLIDAFHRISLIGLVVNLFILFVLGSVLELGLIAVLLSFSETLSAPLFQVCIWLLERTDHVLAYLARLPWAEVWVLNPGWSFWLVWYGGIAIFLVGRDRVRYRLEVVSLRGKRKWTQLRKQYGGLAGSSAGSSVGSPVGSSVGSSVGSPVGSPGGSSEGSLFGSHHNGSRKLILWGSLVLAGLLVWAPWRGQAELEVIFIDVGQGDAILIRTPEKQNILIDAGPKSENFDSGERIVIPYLLETGVRELDALLITHEHQDHIGGAASVLETIPTGWVGVPQVEDRLYLDDWERTLAGYLEQPEEGMVNAGKQSLEYVSGVQTLVAGDRIELGSEAWLEVLAPSEVLAGTHSDANNNSLVVKLHYAGQSLLLTGDMEQEEMASMEETGVEWEADFYKVPHHGSRFSWDEELLDSMDPKAVFISVGKNSFGHPSPEVINYWEQRQVPVYRTDLDGTISLLLDEDGARISTGRAR